MKKNTVHIVLAAALLNMAAAQAAEFDGSWVGLCVDDTGLAASRKLCTLKS